MRAICDLQEALDSISEMKAAEIGINPGFIREAVNEARVYLGYYRGAKETIHKQGKTIHRLRTRIKELEAQIGGKHHDPV